MKQIADGIVELDNGDLQLANGTIIPASKRTKTEVYSRIVGYLRPVSGWNKGKQQEWRDRAVFDPVNAVEKHFSEKEARSA